MNEQTKERRIRPVVNRCFNLRLGTKMPLMIGEALGSAAEVARAIPGINYVVFQFNQVEIQVAASGVAIEYQGADPIAIWLRDPMTSELVRRSL